MATVCNTSNDTPLYDPAREVVARARRLRAMGRTWHQISVITGKSDTWLKKQLSSSPPLLHSAS